MARLVWTQHAISDLNDISEYIALDDPSAAMRLVDRIFEHVAHLAKHPLAGSIPPELDGKRYRQIVENPCRIFYELRNDIVFVLHVIRSEQMLRLSNLETEE